jgi:CHAT domain-containing protein
VSARKFTKLNKFQQLLAGLILGCLLFVGVAPWVQAQVSFPGPSPATLVSLQPRDPLNTVQVNELTTDLEGKWAGIYENFFQESFSSLGLTTAEIGKKLVSLEQETGKKAAVFWINPEKDGVSICLLTGDRPTTGVKVFDTDE